ncbi:guanine nucleotide-binding protein alpha-16 subunit, partial [Reticulomyxa filosa]
NTQDYLQTLCRENKALIDAGIQQCALSESKLEEIRDAFTEEQIPITFDSRLVVNMQRLWNEVKAKFQIPDNVEHFLDRIKEIADPNYIPTFNDYVLCFFFFLKKKKKEKKKSTCYSEEVFFTKTHDTEVRFQFIDVGGQRSERRKWMKFVKEELDCVVFVIGMSDYDLKCFEDNQTKRLDEALAMFTELATTQFFDRKSLIIFFNKFDLFEEKLTKVSFKVAFSDIRDEEAQDPKLVCKFFKQKFLDILDNNKVKLTSPPHFFSTRALRFEKGGSSVHYFFFLLGSKKMTPFIFFILGTKNVHKVIRSIQTDLVRQNLLEQGLALGKA